jgi:phosphate transport system permease protein
MIKELQNLKKRHAAERRFKYIGLGAIVLAFVFLAFLLFSIFGNGLSGFTHTEIKLNVTLTEDDHTGSIRTALDKLFPEATEYSDKAALYGLIADSSEYKLADIAKDKSKIGKTVEFWAVAHPDIDIFYKQKTESWKDSASPKQQEFIKILKEKGLIARHFNFAFFTSGDSQDPEIAGIAGAMIGSLLTVAICMLVALPIGVMTAIYMEEFAPKNRVTDLIEVNINNLAAVPSIVFGLLGLAVYLNYFGMPRSAPVVGGLTLALMTIPVVIIAARAALKAVPPSIRQAAMGIGASPLQVVLHHTLPLAMPGIMTGAILGLARALGETAPLLMIGMVAFIADVPQSFNDPATAMPVQIFLWSKNNQPGFVEKTAAAIIVLLAILVVMNIIAVWIRKKYERRW